MNRILTGLTLIAFTAPSFAIAQNPSDAEIQGKAEQVRAALVDVHNQVLKASDEELRQIAQDTLKTAQKEGNVILAQKVEALLESGQLKKETVLRKLDEQIRSTQNQGLFLVGVAICQAIARFNGGWCFNSSIDEDGGIGAGAFLILTIVTLGDSNAAQDF